MVQPTRDAILGWFVRLAASNNPPDESAKVLINEPPLTERSAEWTRVDAVFDSPTSLESTTSLPTV
jgi:hypothetical protein